MDSAGENDEIDDVEDDNDEHQSDGEVNIDVFDEDDYTVEDEDATQKRSAVWRHFSVIVNNATGVKYAKCNHCDK